MAIVKAIELEHGWGFQVVEIFWFFENDKAVSTREVNGSRGGSRTGRAWCES